MISKKTIIAIIISLFIECPIWLYLLYWILNQLHPDRLIWFLYIIYIPSIILSSILGKIILEEGKK
jgi:hypothetical protein